MEMSVALSILAVFVAAFISLSVRLANAQKHQEARITAIAVLETQFAALREETPKDWPVLANNTVALNGVQYVTTTRLVTERSDPDAGFAVFEATVSWRSVTGLHALTRECWVHERLD